MTMEDFITMLSAIRDDKIVLIPYQLHDKGQLRKLIKSLGGTSEALYYFDQILKAESATIKESA